MTEPFDPLLTRRQALGAGASAGAGALLAAPALARAGSPAPATLATASGAFVTRQGTRLMRHGRPLRYCGANAWYPAWLGADTSAGSGSGRARLGRELDRLAALGVTNVRLLAAGEEGPLKAAARPGFVNRAGELNQALLTGLDHALVELGARGMTAVLYLGNFWEWSGGMMTLLWYETGHYIDNNDPAHPWPAFPDATAEFYRNPAAIGRYLGYAAQLIGRTNSVTGTAYRDDPTIMAWQLANEPHPAFSPAAMARIAPAWLAWIKLSVSMIRDLDPHHLVSLGLEGTIATNDNAALMQAGHHGFDYHTAHVWPLNWHWVDARRLEATWDAGMRKVRAYVLLQERLALAANKPLVIEEFGFPRDGESYDPAATTKLRERYYRLIYSLAEASAAHGGAIAGTNFWGWTGEARTGNADHRFHPGDTAYMADPPHEPQGWYGNFDSDTAMQAVIRSHASAFATGQ